MLRLSSRPTLFPYTTLFRSPTVRTGPTVRTRPMARPRTRRCWTVHRPAPPGSRAGQDRKSTRLNSSHVAISYAVFCLKKKNKKTAVQSDYEVYLRILGGQPD